MVVCLAAVPLCVLVRRLLLVVLAARWRSTDRASHRSSCDLRLIVACTVRNGGRGFSEVLRALDEVVASADTVVVLIDDGSDDGSLALMETWAARARGRAIVVSLGVGPPRGKAGALQAGLELSLPDFLDDEADQSNYVLVSIDDDHQLRPGLRKEIDRAFGHSTTGALALDHTPSLRAATLVGHYAALEQLYTERITARAALVAGSPPSLAGVWACRLDLFREMYDGTWGLADDLELGARVWMKGYDVALSDAPVSVHQVPCDVRSFVRQRRRWSQSLYSSTARIRSDLAKCRRRSFPGRMLAAVLNTVGYAERPLLLVWFAVATVALPILFGRATWALWLLVTVAAGGLVFMVQVLWLARSVVDYRIRIRKTLISLPVMFCVDVYVSVTSLVQQVRRTAVEWDR